MASITDLRRGFELGPWTVLPDLGLLRCGETKVHLEPKVMDVLVLLASAEGDVVTTDRIVDAVWGGRATAPEAIVAKIKALRNKLGDDARSPTYIQTLHKIGYRLVCPVALSEPPQAPAARRRPPAYLAPLAAGGLVVAVILILVYAVPRPAPETGPISSVAVCPFENLSTEADQPFVFGFREQLVSTLYRIASLKVVKGFCEDPLHKLPKVLGVDSVVTGSVQQAGGRVRITAQLVSRNGVILWSDSIDGAAEQVEEVFGLHEQVANRVGDAIRGTTEIEVTASSRPASFGAYDRYLEGDFAFSKRSKPDLDRAVRLFDEAIEIDPNFGPAYLGLAKSYIVLADFPAIDRESMYVKALAIADKGARLDPAIRGPLGTVYGFVATKRRNWTEAQEAFESAINSSPVYPTAHQWYSQFLANVGLLERSLQHARIARDMSTAEPILNTRLGVAYHWNNDSANAGIYYAIADAQQVGSPAHNLAYTLYLIRERRYDEARIKARRAFELYGLETAWLSSVFDGLLKRDDREAMARTVASITAAKKRGDLPTNIELTIWALLGRGDRAMQAAWALYEAGDLHQLELIYLDEFRVLHAHEQFPKFLDALGLTAYWQSIGCRWDGTRVACAR